MELIPAIDLKNYKVVFASNSIRDNYKEIPSTLSPTSEPIKFIKYLQTICNFNTIYIADLDSINKFTSKNYIIEEILVTFKNINFIIDNGVRTYSEIYTYKSINYTQIIATETFIDYKLLHKKSFIDYILSVDCLEKKIISMSDDYKFLKPKSVICMNLDNIGRKTGINHKNLYIVKKHFPCADLIYSGGIKNKKNIKNLKKKGCNKVILLTAILEKIFI